MGTWSSRSVTLLIAGPLSCMLYPLGGLLLVTQTGGDTPIVVGHYIKCVSLSRLFPACFPSPFLGQVRYCLSFG